jgi:thioesterase domain-containing protein
MDNFFELGGHSLLTVRLFAYIEQVFGRRLPLSIIFKAPTIEQLVGILEDKGWSASWGSLVPIKSTGSRRPFYCVHSAGGAVLELYPLASHLSPDQPFFGLQDPGIDGGSIVELTVEEMASRYIQEMRSVQPEGPYIIGGNCFGALVAYEMAQQINAQGEEVAALIFIEGYYRDRKKPGSAPDPSKFRQFIYFIINKINLEKTNLSVRGTKEKLTYICSRAKRTIEKSWVKIQKILDQIFSTFNLRNQHSLHHNFEILHRLHIKALREYEAKPYSGRVVILKARQKSFGFSSDVTLGWGEILNREPEVIEVPGLHENIINEPWVKALAEKLTDSLERLNHDR